MKFGRKHDHSGRDHGGRGGIGLATAKAFLAQGAKVALGDLDGELVASVANELGANVLGLPLDVTDPAAFATFLDAAEAGLGPLDVLVNNAGIMPTGLFVEEDPTMTDRILDINLRGVITGSRLALERFTGRGQGHLVNIASLAGVTGFPGLATYCATKFAVVGLTEALEREVRDQGIAVTCVLPGVVRTELSAGTNSPKWVEALSTLDPEDVASAIVAAVRTRKPKVTVPKRLGATLTTTSLLPRRVRIAAERLTGAGKAFTEPDPRAREIYHERLRRQG